MKNEKKNTQTANANAKKLAEKYAKTSTPVLEKMAKVKTGEELEIIQNILAERAEKEPNTGDPVVYQNPEALTEEEKTAIENAEKAYNGEAVEEAPKKDKKAKTPKEPKPVRELKKCRSVEEAKIELAEAIKNKGRMVTVKLFRGHEEVTGVIIGARLDTRSNFVQYRIRLKDGRMIGKGVDNPDIQLGDLAPVEAKPAKAKEAAEVKTEEAAEAAEVKTEEAAEAAEVKTEETAQE